ncbi:MAG: RNA polymerase sigma-70 factor [Bacteroidota bacterium]|nr:RNA polymerase subunit sigma-70 [Odoribacter sp.]MDP3644582.1 RNA polymerase sigma-70 factor [Bacteroidota bacterium]
MLVKDDKAYVECLKKDDYSAFDALFHKYSVSLYAFALSITRNPFAAEEITQLVFLKVWEKKAQINEHLSFKSFLFSVAYHETISWLRKENSEKRRIGEYTLLANSMTNETEQAVEFRNMELVTGSLIEEMPEKRKEIFRLSREQGFSNKEIAERLNISVKTVENQMTSALKYLREKLGKYHILGLLFYFLMYH